MATKQKICKELGNFIKQQRKSLGMTALELAVLVGTSPNYIFQLEAGRRTPSLLLFFMIMQALQVKNFAVPKI